jgi:hypothetical protein
MVYPALLPLMRTPRLPVVDWTDTPADLNGLVRFAERRNLLSARVPSHFKCSLHTYTYIRLIAKCHSIEALLRGFFHQSFFYSQNNSSISLICLNVAVWLCQVSLNNRCSTYCLLRKVFLRPLRALYKEATVNLYRSNRSPFSIDYYRSTPTIIHYFLNYQLGWITEDFYRL